VDILLNKMFGYGDRTGRAGDIGRRVGCGGTKHYKTKKKTLQSPDVRSVPSGGKEAVAIRQHFRMRIINQKSASKNAITSNDAMLIQSHHLPCPPVLVRMSETKPLPYLQSRLGGVHGCSGGLSKEYGWLPRIGSRTVLIILTGWGKIPSRSGQSQRPSTWPTRRVADKLMSGYSEVAVHNQRFDWSVAEGRIGKHDEGR